MAKSAGVHQTWMTEFGGICIGVQILAKAVDKLPLFSHDPVRVGFLFLAGLFVVLGSLFHKTLERRIRNTHSLFHIIEGVVMAVSAWILVDKGKFRLPAFIAFVGCLYVLLGVMGYVLNKSNYKKYGKPLLRSVGAAFFLFGLVAIIANLNYDKDPWVFGIAGMFVAIGVFYGAFTNWLFAKLEKIGAPEEGPADLEEAPKEETSVTAQQPAASNPDAHG
jgi:hypothetical protein